MKQSEEYILGTDADELHRLGVQHQVWASEAQKGWELANFREGQTLLDLGCGPGFCSTELGYLVGQSGKVLAIDRSETYINYLNKISEYHSLNIETRQSLFSELKLEPNSLDGVFSRWVLGWVEGADEVLQELYKALKPGGKIVLQEYYNWSSHAVYPQKPAMTHAINTALKSFKDLESELDIGNSLPQTLSAMGMEIVNLRLLPKLGTPENSVWQWPKTFYETYFPKLVENGYLSQAEMQNAFAELSELEATPGAMICCPLMVEVIAAKPRF
ncbi:methyltransferase domain-containing protein [bacterium]|nr:methyltransferase domain-containing protein [bacterium]